MDDILNDILDLYKEIESRQKNIDLLVEKAEEAFCATEDVGILNCIRTYRTFK